MIHTEITTRENRLTKWFAFVFLLTVSSRAASLYTETFDSSTAGWYDKDPGKMIVTNVLSGGNPGGAIRGIFAFQAIPIPENDGFIATTNLSAANFLGNYEEVDAWLLGFDFMASNIVPSDLQVHLYSSNNVIRRPLVSAISTTNVWYSFRIPLLAAELGGWEGDTSLFSSILTNVTRVEFRILRQGSISNSPAQFYFLDNIFLSRVPDAVDFTGDQMTWLHLSTGWNYRLEASSNLNEGAWTMIDAFTATTAVYQANVSITNGWRFYRMTSVP